MAKPTLLDRVRAGVSVALNRDMAVVKKPPAVSSPNSSTPFSIRPRAAS